MLWEVSALPATSLSVRGPGYTRMTYQPDSQVVAHPGVIAEEGYARAVGRPKPHCAQPLLYGRLDRPTVTGHRIR